MKKIITAVTAIAVTACVLLFFVRGEIREQRKLEAALALAEIGAKAMAAHDPE
jgi:hypothetical protein